MPVGEKPVPTAMATNSNPIRAAAEHAAIIKKFSYPWNIGKQYTP
jgi:hypothetical protein